ncbi:MAG: 2OG-Fe(II) oxygenase family protein [Pseudomonadota bacterium]
MSISVVDMRSANADELFVDTLRRTGFAVLRNSSLTGNEGVDSEPDANAHASRLARMAERWKAFFLGDEKWQYEATETESGNTSGYISPDVSETAVGHDKKDLKEFFHIVPDTRMPESLRADTTGHLAAAQQLGRQLLAWLDQHCASELPAEIRGQLSESLSPRDSLLRILHYPPLEGVEPEGAVRAAAHEDINLLTLLPVSAEPGLQVLLRNGEWADVPGQFGDIIINSGDMLQEASKGALPSTSHRVVNPEGPASRESRIAMPYFLAPRLDLPLSERYTAGSYLKERLEQLAR